MANPVQVPIRVLIVDDEADIRDAYRHSLRQSGAGEGSTGFRDLEARLFNKAGPSPSPAAPTAPNFTFDAVYCDQAHAAIVAVEKALAQSQPFAVVFLDVRMPPGKDGVWAAARIQGR